MRALSLCFGLLTLLGLAAAACAQDLLVRGGTVLTGAGETIEGGAVLIVDGRIRAVGRDLSAGAGTRVIDATGRFVCPGFLDAHSHVGIRRAELDETVLPFSDEVSPLAALDPSCPALRASLEAGVTTALLAPGAANPLAGPGVAVKLADCRPLGPAATVSLSLSTSALHADRKPTSMSVMLSMLRAALAAAAQPGATSPLARALQGGLPVQVVCDGPSSVLQALALMREFGLHGSILVPRMPRALPELLRGAGVTALVPPLAEMPEERFQQRPSRLAEAGVPLAFASMAVGDEIADVRTSAGLAVAAGLPREEALRALTGGAAETLGIADRVGSLAEGKDGDLLIVSGHPTDLSASIDVVVSDGVVVYERGKR